MCLAISDTELVNPDMILMLFCIRADLSVCAPIDNYFREVNYLLCPELADTGIDSIYSKGVGNDSRAPIETRNELDGQSSTRVVTISCAGKRKNSEDKRRRRR